MKVSVQQVASSQLPRDPDSGHPGEAIRCQMVASVHESGLPQLHELHFRLTGSLSPLLSICISVMPVEAVAAERAAMAVVTHHSS